MLVRRSFRALFFYAILGGIPHMLYLLLHCNNKLCRYNVIEALLCGATDIHYVDRLCITFKRRPGEDNYRELMRSSEPAGYKRGGKYVSN